jgi:hypothetical protein
MGRFLNMKAAPPPDRKPAPSQQAVAGQSATAIATAVDRIEIAPARAPVKTEQTNWLQTIGLYALILSLFASLANDLLLRLIGSSSYLYYVSFPLSMIAFIAGGTMFRGLRTTAGKLWLFMMIWLVLGWPFSVWRGGTWEVLKEYIPRAHVIFFMVCAFAVTFKQFRTFFNAQILISFAVLLSCVAFGGTPGDTGRFCIPGSVFFENPNDLSIELLISMGLFAALLWNRNNLLRVVGLAGIVAALYYLFKASSRGAFLACVVMIVVVLVTSKARLKLAVIVVPTAIVALALNPYALHRISTIFLDPAKAEINNETDEANVASQIERQYLLRRSIELSFTHPIFGVGAGEFIDATSGADQRGGKHSAALGTHNTYTQISSETGLPGFFCFAGVLFLTIRNMWRLHKRTRDRADGKETSTMAYSLFLTSVGYAAAIFFHHSGYGATLPLLGGMAAALEQAAPQAKS